MRAEASRSGAIGARSAMISAESHFELAELRASQERDAAIADAIASVLQEGTPECIGCGDPIPAKRRAVAPFARRCIECQTFHEQEKLHR
jgi:phage/conjugal plasmid C-4 type zinc finger TraR family protein